MGEELEIKEPDGGEKKEATPPSSVSDGIKKFMDKQAGKEEPKKEDPPAKPDAQLSKEEPKVKDKGDPAYQDVFIVDKDGNKVPYRMTVDGEVVEVTDPKLFGQYLRLGYHSDKTGKSLNDRESALKDQEVKLQQEIGAFGKGQELLGKLQAAIEEGRLSLTDPASSIKGEPTIDEELYSDPATLELKKENMSLAKTIDGIQKQLEVTNKMLLGKIVEEQKKTMDGEIEKLEPTYGLADKGKVWDLLAMQKEDGSPVHTIESAMKQSHKEETAKFENYVKLDPNFTKLSDEEKEKAVKDYLEKKSAREKPAVSSPSGSPAGGDKPTKEDRTGWRMADYAKAGTAMVAKRIAAAKQS